MRSCSGDLKKRRLILSTINNGKIMSRECRRGKYFEYYAVNISFLAVILAVFIYSALFSPDQDHPVQCAHVEYANAECPSCGLSEGFSHILRGNFTQARESNINTVPLFLFFVVQFFMRGFSSLLLYREAASKNAVLITDSLLSLLLFLLCFRHLLLSAFNLLL